MVLACAVLVPAAPAWAGQAASGEPLFYPCSSCHPVTVSDGKTSRPLPNGFDGHRVKLEAHDRLGRGDAACLVCHDDPAKDPGKLKLMDGSLVDIAGDVSSVCYRCHSAKYREWKAGTHGKGLPKCTASGCHDPHTPSWIYAEPTPPFVATGFQARAVSERVAFTPLASFPVPPPVETPAWLMVAATLGVALSAGIAGALTLGRFKR